MLLNKRSLLILCLLVTPAFLFAQSTAEEIETFLSASTVTYAQAARFALEAAGVLAADNPEEAFAFALQRNWLPGKADPGDYARLDHISLLLMASFDMKGGLMYSIFRNPRYAYRELIHLNVIQNRASPSIFVSGEMFLFYVTRMLALNEMLGALNAVLEY